MQKVNGNELTQDREALLGPVGRSATLIFANNYQIFDSHPGGMIIEILAERRDITWHKR